MSHRLEQTSTVDVKRRTDNLCGCTSFNKLQTVDSDCEGTGAPHIGTPTAPKSSCLNGDWAEGKKQSNRARNYDLFRNIFFFLDVKLPARVSKFEHSTSNGRLARDERPIRTNFGPFILFRCRDRVPANVAHET